MPNVTEGWTPDRSPDSTAYPDPASARHRDRAVRADPADPADRRRRLPAARPWPGLLTVLIGAVVIAADQFTKELALRELADGPIPVIDDWLRWRLVFNPGAAFSLGESITPVFTFFQAAVAVGVLVMAWRLRSVWWAATLGLVMGGAAGNLYDRLFRPPSFGHGHVVDFVSVGTFPVFNVADSAITIAAGLIVVAAVLDMPAFGERAADEGEVSGSGERIPPGQRRALDRTTRRRRNRRG